MFLLCRYKRGGGRREVLTFLVMRATYSALFCLLGVCYLLPFNTIINSYENYSKSVENGLLSPLTLLQILCVLYQVGGIVFNGLALLEDFRVSGRERVYGGIMSVISVINMLAMIPLVWFRLTDWVQILVLLTLALINSLCQAVTDTCTLYFTRLFGDRRYILFYSMGVNISGSIHALLLIILSTSLEGGDGRVLFTSYYAVTAAILATPTVIYATLFRGVARPVPPREALHPPRLRWNRRGWHYIALAGSNFILTLFIYPGLLLRGSSVAEFSQYNNTIVFLGFNLSALFGNMLALSAHPDAPLLARLLLIRVGLVVPVVVLYLINAAWTGVLLILVFCQGFLSGYVCSNVFYRASRLRNSADNSVLLVRLVNLAISLGLFAGNLSSLLFTFLLPQK